MKVTLARKVVFGALMAVAGPVTALVLFASPAAGGAASSDHVTICHRTGSHSNPYVVISPSASGVYNGHYTEHNENAVFPNTASDGKWGDIIPPFVYKGVTYSLNWTADGQAVFNNGCQIPGSTTTTATTPTTTTTVPVTTTTTVPVTTTVTTPTTTTTPAPPPHKKHHHKKPKPHKHKRPKPPKKLAFTY